MIKEEIDAKLGEDDPIRQGYYSGRMVFELIAIVVPASKLGVGEKLGKLAKETKSALFERVARRLESIPPGTGKVSDFLAATKLRVAARATEFATTKMCVVAGTPVHTADGLLAIEEVRPGMMALSRDPLTGIQGYKEVLDAFVTHPERLYHITIGSGLRSEDGDDDGVAKQTLVCTGEHPFYVVEVVNFVEASELRVGDRLSFLDGSEALVLAVGIEEAPEGKTFTTYNFEVEGWHTYFAGVRGVWVHNAGRAPCEKVFSIYHRLRNRGLDPWEALEETVNKTPGVPAQTYGLAAGEAMDEIYRLAAAGENVKIPSHSEVRALMTGKNVKFKDAEIPEGSFFATLPENEAVKLFRKLELESHHGAPRKFQEWLGIPDDKWDDSPAYLTSFLEHQGKDVGIHQALAAELGFPLRGARPTGFTDAELVAKLRKAYKNIDLEDFGNVALDWLEDQL